MTRVKQKNGLGCLPRRQNLRRGIALKTEQKKAKAKKHLDTNLQRVALARRCTHAVRQELIKGAPSEPQDQEKKCKKCKKCKKNAKNAKKNAKSKKCAFAILPAPAATCKHARRNT